MAFSAATLIQRAYESAQTSARVPIESALSLQLGANLLCGPELIRTNFFSVPC